jgi:hypothetical protein
MKPCWTHSASARTWSFGRCNSLYTCICICAVNEFCTC